MYTVSEQGSHSAKQSRLCASRLFSGRNVVTKTLAYWEEKKARKAKKEAQCCSIDVAEEYDNQRTPLEFPTINFIIKLKAHEPRMVSSILYQGAGATLCGWHTSCTGVAASFSASVCHVRRAAFGGILLGAIGTAHF
jgi:hypothetical protein